MIIGVFSAILINVCLGLAFLKLAREFPPPLWVKAVLLLTWWTLTLGILYTAQLVS